ncbi:MAG: ABC-F family ATP-binding cassette domain-containing protein [Chloroflexi bacterium]|nr:ABC-F family ATP-binding cassette domain-containing protein [Chloroflexota bacterium]
MTIISLQELSKSFGGRPILEPLSWSIDGEARIGLVGANGTGKSTLLRMMAGLEPLDGGSIVRRRGLRVSYLAQEVAGTDNGVLATVLSSRADLAALEAELAAVEARLSTPEVAYDSDLLTAVLDQQAALLERFEELGGPRIRNEAVAHLRSLGITDEDFELPTRFLSGGQRKLIALAGCLLQQPDLLLLDEPDTHLDLAHKAQLENLIRAFDGAVVIVSHDRYLLDETVTTIVELENRSLTVWEGNYSAYAVAKEIALLRQQELYVAQQKEIARLEAAIARFKLWASIVVNERHIKQARNKQRQIDRMDKVDRPVLERKRMGLQFHTAQRGGQKALELRDVTMAFGDDLILLGLKHTFWRGERVGIVGANGSGKTVLGRLLTGQLMPTDGEIWRGPSIEIGYYAQGHETLDMQATLVETIRAVKPMYEEQAVGFLGKFLFPYQMVQQPVHSLSGGERSRLQLARLMLSGANCLVLDEPTNHLDIASAEVLEGALADYTGTVITISHDRYFLDRIADRTVEIADGDIAHYEGGYSAYLEQKARKASVVIAQPEPRRAKRLA